MKEQNKIPEEVERLLVEQDELINSTDFIASDPVQFPRRFSDLRDIEIVAILSATIAWGNRKMICSNCEKMLRLMDYQPYAYVADRGFEDLGERFNIHRTFFSDDFYHMLNGLERVYRQYGSINNFAKAREVAASPTPAWRLVELLNAEMLEANGTTNPRCFPLGLDKTALKRINMALRWLVRRDGIVDMGIWDCINPAQLFIPLDVHVGNTARALGLLTRRSNDKQAVLDLTETLRTLKPDDPVVFDYALFGIGITGILKN